MRQSPEAKNSSRVISTTICFVEEDAAGHILHRFCVTIRGPSTTSSDTPRDS